MKGMTAAEANARLGADNIAAALLANSGLADGQASGAASESAEILTLQGIADRLRELAEAMVGSGPEGYQQQSGDYAPCLESVADDVEALIARLAAKDVPQ